MANMRVHLAHEDDLEEILEADRECFPGEPWDDPEGDTLWIATQGKDLVGYAGARVSTHYTGWIYLTRAGVVDRFRGRGLQQRMIRARCAWARRQGLFGAYTYTRDNPASGNALIACGFRLFDSVYTMGAEDERWFKLEWRL